MAEESDTTACQSLYCFVQIQYKVECTIGITAITASVAAQLWQQNMEVFAQLGGDG